MKPGTENKEVDVFLSVSGAWNTHSTMGQAAGGIILHSTLTKVNEVPVHVNNIVLKVFTQCISVFLF